MVIDDTLWYLNHNYMRGVFMRIKIVPVGTSKGIRIPKYLLDKYELTHEIELEDTGAGLLIKPLKKPRTGWENAFKKAIEKQGEDYSIEMPASEWDKYG